MFSTDHWPCKSLIRRFRKYFRAFVPKCQFPLHYDYDPLHICPSHANNETLKLGAEEYVTNSWERRKD